MPNLPKSATISGSAKPIELPISDLSHEGQGIGHADGLAVFVAGGLPGDFTRILIEKKHSRYAVGKPIKLLRPSPDRILPACPLAGRCGGCTLQALAYPAQLRIKQQQIADALQRIGKVANISLLLQPIIGMANPWHYRAKVQFPVSGTSQEPVIGFYAAASHRVVDGDVCAIQPPICDAIRAAVRRHLQKHQIEPYNESTHSGLLRHLVIRLGVNTGEVMVTLVINGESLPGQMELYETLKDTVAGASAGDTSSIGGLQQAQHSVGSREDPKRPSYQLSSFWLNINRAKTNVIQSDDLRLLAGRAWIEEEILGIRYRISPLAFFQVNPSQAARLFAVAVNLAAPQPGETILDLYCGTGSIALQLAQQAGQVIGIEINESAIADARANAELNGISNARFLTGAAETLLPQMAADSLSVDCIVVDPPRKGCEQTLLDTLIQLQPGRIVYVSCNPATLARDIALLAPAGYTIQTVQPVDLFPWTMHVETVVLITRVVAGKA
jgi:23S rRNA (uracil1939-C5)-methyltransferase